MPKTQLRPVLLLLGLVLAVSCASDGAHGTSFPTNCGDGYVDEGEDCDDGGETESCNIDCSEAGCGDGVINAAAGEECEPSGLDDTACSDSCELSIPPNCGDQHIDDDEECDDGGESSLCNRDCTAAACGDRKLNVAAGERCDDGNVAAGDGCSPACQAERAGICGNGTIEGDEECDDGIQTAMCDTDCTHAICGDGVSNNAASEQCDDGNAESGDGCSETCALERDPDCGNNELDDGEACDDGDESAFCNADCTVSNCGDGKLNVTAGEECDDRGVVSGDGCSAACQIEPPSLCGNGIIEGLEQCDDKGSSADCDSDCTLPSCRDGVLNEEAGEDCDDGGESADCNLDCTLAMCGDGAVNASAGEQCDDGNLEDEDGCSSRCQLEPLDDCGNGTVEGNEECDETRETADCNADCTASDCGDGKVNVSAGEACDDGNADDDDGCSRNCKLEGSPTCGNGICEGAETCHVDSCQRDCGSCSQGRGCKVDADCADGLQCAPGPSGTFACVPESADNEPAEDSRWLEAGPSLGCGVAIGSIAQGDAWTDNGDGTYTLSPTTGALAIRTPLGDIPLQSDGITYDPSDQSFSFDAGGLPVPGFSSLPPIFQTEISTSALFTLKVEDGADVNAMLDDDGIGNETVPEGTGFMVLSVLDPRSVSPGSFFSSDSSTPFGIEDAGDIHFILDPCDPLFLFHAEIPVGEFTFEGIGMSVHGNIGLESALPLWDGSTNVVRSVEGNGYLQGSFTLPIKKTKIGGIEFDPPGVQGSMLIDFDPANDGVAGPEIFEALLKGDVVKTGDELAQADIQQMISGEMTLSLPIPEVAAEVLCAGDCPSLHLGEAAAHMIVGCGSRNTGACASGDQLLFAGQSTEDLFKGSDLEGWFPPPPGGSAVRGYYRSPTDWGYRTTRTMSLFGGLGPSFDADILMKVDGTDVKLTAKGKVDLDTGFSVDIPLIGDVDVDLGSAMMNFKMDFGKAQFCGATGAEAAGVGCDVEVCAGIRASDYALHPECCIPSPYGGDDICVGF